MYQNPLTIEEKLKLLRMSNRHRIRANKMVKSLGGHLKDMMKLRMLRKEEMVARTTLENKKRIIQIDGEIEKKRKELHDVDVKSKMIENSEDAMKLLMKIAEKNKETSIMDSILMSDSNTTMFIANLLEETDTKNEKIIEKRKIANVLN